MRLRDAIRRPFRAGLYCIGTDRGVKSMEFYRVYREKGVWKAENTRGEVLELGIPLGMPDSSRMPRGQIDAGELNPVNPELLKYYLEEATRLAVKSSLDTMFLLRNS